ncbi:HTH-type transcriptional regulator HdfR [Pseudomonas sp. MM221]|nr:HTH-type transcriptional regulator HdfR [Pseudomonas sp. MM221]
MSERIQALHALRAFEVASRYGSFTRAAEELALTQGAVSHHIKTLEALFGCDLFERRGPKLSLTEHGRLLAQERKWVSRSSKTPAHCCARTATACA